MTRIVLADDHQLFLDGLLSLLSASSGIDIVGTALNGRSAIALLEKESPDLILLDVNMPEMDGYATTKLIRKMGEPWKSIPIIALTADAMIGDKERCIAAGMDDYVSKPFRLEEIEEVLKRKVLMA